MQQALSRYYGNAATHCYTTGTATLLWKCNMVHRSCYQGKPNMSQYYSFLNAFGDGVLLLLSLVWNLSIV
jgi:hypothetical protein